MATSHCENSRALAQRLLLRDILAINEFAERHRKLLEPGHEEMATRLATQFPPGCRLAFEGLTPHVARQCGYGYVESAPNDSLPQFVQVLVLSDLYTASACLARDASANMYFMFLVDRRVRPKMVQKFADRLGEGRTNEIVDNMVSRCWSADSGEIAGDELDPTDRESLARTPKQPRLAVYYGRCTLLSWLYTMATNSLKDSCRSKRSYDRPLEPSCDEDEQGASWKQQPTGPTAEDDRLQIAAAKHHDALRKCVDQYITNLRRAGPKRAQDFLVAYLWISCRVRAKEIANELRLTRARIAQITAKIKDECVHAAADILHQIAKDIDEDDESVRELLREDVPGIGTPVLFEHIRLAVLALRDAHPELVHVAYLVWARQLSISEIARQRQESPEIVQQHIDRLTTWLQRISNEVTDTLHRESGVDRSILTGCVESAVTDWLGRPSNT